MKTTFKTCALLGGWLVFSALPAATFAAEPAVPALPAPVPPPFHAESPVLVFRELLALPQAERESRLAARSEASRALLERKLREYDALPAPERDARLRSVELHYYLKTLFLAPAAVRASWLTQVPADYRRICEDRLRLWDVLPEELQQVMLHQDTALHALTRVPNPVRSSPPVPPVPATPAGTAWDKAEQASALSPRDLQRILDRVSPTNRPRTERLVRTLSPLSASQRVQYLEALRKFTQLDATQKARFMQGWERWQSMTDSEKAVWRKLASRLPPSLPIPPLPSPGGPAPHTGT